MLALPEPDLLEALLPPDLAVEFDPFPEEVWLLELLPLPPLPRLLALLEEEPVLPGADPELPDPPLPEPDAFAVAPAAELVPAVAPPLVP